MDDRLQGAVDKAWSIFAKAIADVTTQLDAVSAGVVTVTETVANAPVVVGAPLRTEETPRTWGEPPLVPPIDRGVRSVAPETLALREYEWSIELTQTALENATATDLTDAANSLARAVGGDVLGDVVAGIAGATTPVAWADAAETAVRLRAGDATSRVVLVLNDSTKSELDGTDSKSLRDSLQPYDTVVATGLAWPATPEGLTGLMLIPPAGTLYSAVDPTLAWERVSDGARFVVMCQLALHAPSPAAVPLTGQPAGPAPTTP